MLILTPSDTIQLVLASSHTTNPCQIACSFRDIDSSSFLPESLLSNSNGTTDVNIISSPASGFRRVVDFISVFNNDTVNHTVTIKFDVSSVEYRLYSASIGPGERIQYTDSQGFVTYNSAGAIKSINTGTANPISSGWSTNVLAADVTNNNATANTIQDITGLSFPVVSGQRYNFKFTINYTAAATTTGARFSINGPAFSELRYSSRYSLTTTTETVNHGLAAYDLPAASNASSAATGANIAIIEGFILPSADGTVIGRFASEVISSAIVAKRGSIVEFIAV